MGLRDWISANCKFAQSYPENARFDERTYNRLISKLKGLGFELRDIYGRTAYVLALPDGQHTVWVCDTTRLWPISPINPINVELDAGDGEQPRLMDEAYDENALLEMIDNITALVKDPKYQAKQPPPIPWTDEDIGSAARGFQ